MTRRFGLRTRLTLLVALVFAAAISITSVVVVNLVEDDLIDDTRASAETVLTTYLESIYGGTATVGVIDAVDTTRFFYLDQDGNEIGQLEYFETIAGGIDDDFAAMLESTDLTGGVMGSGAVSSAVVVEPLDAVTLGGFQIDPDTGELLDPTGSAVTFVVGPQPVGEPQRVDVGDDAVGVAQTLAFADGMTVDVGVSSPLQPVTESLDTIRQLLLIAVPALVLVVAAITWLAATRALAPVHAITSRARAISASNIDERVPVHEANDEIHELATTMNEMLARLERSQRRQHQFVADASHELRSPVAASLTQLEVARANPDTTDWPATAATVLAEQEHLRHLIDDLLALSRVNEAAQAPTGDVDLDELIAAEARRPHAVAVRTSVTEPVRVGGDAALLARALRNLVDNAARHANTDVLVSLQRSTGVAAITVDDDGPGVPEADRDRIFDRFARLDEARARHSGGAGLGLAIAREVARAHRGDVAVETGPLGGARFTLTLPAVPAQEVDPGP